MTNLTYVFLELVGVGLTEVKIYRKILEVEFSKQREVTVGVIGRAKVTKKTHTPKNHSDVSFSRIELSIIITLSMSECDTQSGVT